VAKHGKAADRFGLGRLVLQNVPMLFKKTVFEPDNVGGDPGGGPSQSREAAMRYDVIAFCNDELVLIVLANISFIFRARRSFNESSQNGRTLKLI
jgi:hypothetical protein